MDEPNYNITKPDGTVVGSVGANSSGDVAVEHAASGEQVILTEDGLDVGTVSAEDATIDFPDSIGSTYKFETINPSSISGDYGDFHQATGDVAQTTKTILEVENESRRAMFVLVSGSSTSNDDRFYDIVFYAWRGSLLNVVSQMDIGGPTRTYDTPANSPKLTLSTGPGTWNVSVRAIQIGGN